VANEINISLTSKSTPTINLQIGDEAKKIVETSASAPVITFIATGEKGEQGIAGTANIDDNSVTSSQIANGTITSAQIENGTISTEDIGTQQITSAKLSNNVITTQKIANDAITGQKIADNSISANHIVNGTIVQELITDLSLTGGKLQNNSIDVTKLVNNTITAAKIANKTLTGAEIEDNVVLGGQVTVTSIFVQGSSPGYISGPSADDLIIRSNDDLIFQLDYDQASQANTSNYRFRNGSGTDLMVLAEGGDLNLTGNIQLSGNIVVGGTVDGVDIANTLAPVQSSLSKLPYITVTQGVNLDTMESNIATNNAKTGITTTQASAITANTNKTGITTSQASAITANTAKTGITTSQANAITANTAKPDLTVDGAGTVHANNYTDTVYTHPSNHAISVITGLQTALNAKQDAIGNEDLSIQQTDGLQDALDAKVDDSQVLTNVPANAVFTDTNTTYSVQDGELSQNNFTDADHTKLNGIEASADVTDAANVTAAGALMDSELTDLAGVKGVTISTLQVKPSEGAFANGDKTKLDSIEASATADQTQSEINALGITAVGISGPTDGDVSIVTDGNISVTLDNDNDESNQYFEIRNSATGNVFSIGEDGNVTLVGTVDGRDVSADGTKLDGIENGATADQTNVTGSSGSCTGNAATATALTTGNKNITGTLGVTELITSKQRHLLRCGFYGNASRMYMPFNYGGTFENTSTAGYSEYGAVIMPCDGYVESVIIRSEQACGNSSVTVLVASNGTEVPTLSPGSFVSPTVNMAADDTSYKFTGFANQGGGANSFSAGDVIMIAFDPTSSSYDTTATAVLVFDWNNQL